MAFVLNRAYEKATCVLKEDCLGSFRTMRQKNSDNRLIVKPAFRFTKNGASSMAFVLNRAYEKATWGLKEDNLGSARTMRQKNSDNRLIC